MNSIMSRLWLILSLTITKEMRKVFIHLVTWFCCEINLMVMSVCYLATWTRQQDRPYKAVSCICGQYVGGKGYTADCS